MAGGRSKKLADRLNRFNEELIAFVESCTDEDWRKIGAEQWPIGVTARHIATAHYSAVAAAKRVLKGEQLPVITMEQVTENANRHAREHSECTKSEVLDLLRQNGRKIVEFAADLQDAGLNKTGYVPVFGAEMSVERLLESAILQAANEHFKNIKAATGK
jgi:GTP cyclohydrolase II